MKIQAQFADSERIIAKTDRYNAPPSLNIRKDVGLLFRNTRRELGLTQQEMGDRIGATRQTIAKWEDGNIPDCAMPTVCKVIGQSLSDWKREARDWRVKYDLLEHSFELMRTRLRSIID